MVFIAHWCKDEKCNNAWVDKDLKKSMSPPKWKYCPDCESKGKVSPTIPPVDKNRSEISKRINSAKKSALNTSI